MDPQNQAAWVVAVIAGLLSFLSPCVLPLIPGYLSMVSGLSVEQLQERRGSILLRVFLSCTLFSVGLCLVYILVGMGVGTVGQWLKAYETLVNVIFGIIVILFGLFVAGLLRLPFLYQDRRLRLGQRSLGFWGAPLLGFAFGFGWTPCLSPYVGTLIGFAVHGRPLESAALFGLFGAVFGLCFIVTGVLFAYALRAFSFFQRHSRVVELVGGTLLVVIGLLLVSQRWDDATAWLLRVLER
jgi:cytochrome c-type biogenesis protein